MDTVPLDPILPVLDEVTHLARTAWSLQRKTKDHQARTTPFTDTDEAVELTTLDALHREIIGSLCRLDDPAKEYMSLRFAADHLSKATAHDLTWIPKANGLLTDFRQAINGLKVSHRNGYIGHLTKAGYAQRYERSLMLSHELRSAVLLTFQIVDHLLGFELDYMWPKRDSNELLNLRFSLENPEHWNAA